LIVAASVALVATPVLALNPGTDLWVISAGKGGQWVTDLVVHNPGGTVAAVDIYWLPRNTDNTAAVPVSYTVNPRETLFLDDVVTNAFGLTEGLGAIRLTSNAGVLLTSRIYDRGDGITGTKGQGFEGVPIEASISSEVGKAQTRTTITNIRTSDAYRTNFFAVGTSTEASSITWTLVDDQDNVIATADTTFPAMAAKYWTFEGMFPAAAGDLMGSVIAQATAGSSLVVASTIDETSGDPATLEMSWTMAPAMVGKTGQQTCYDQAGTEIGCAGTGQDGDIRPGVGWPNPRFVDNGDGTVSDMLTGLIWLKNANCFGARDWTTALADANTLASGDCGLTDSSVAGAWRLPSLYELLSLMDLEYVAPALSDTAGTGQWSEGDVFTGVQANRYWSSSSRADDPSFAFTGGFFSGHVYTRGKTVGLYVWPVRGEQ
jgi:hypothetical protein